MEENERILKRDAAGRVWTPRAQREAALDEYERSEMPATKFAADIGVKYQTFASWVRKRRQARSAGGVKPGAAAPAALGWVEATLENGGGGRSGALVVSLPGGVRLEVMDAAQVMLAAQLLRALNAGGWTC
jgi:hypothetical protein